MATQFFAERDIQAGKWSSPSFTLPTVFTGKQISVRLGSSQWADKTGEVEFGVEYSTDNGSTWKLLFSAFFTIGVVGRINSAMPYIACNYSDLEGKKIRVFVNSTVTIKLSASGEIT